MIKIAIIDGQGGGIGSAVIKKIKEAYGESVELIALEPMPLPQLQ